MRVLIKLCVSLLLLLVIFRSLDTGAALEAMTGANPRWLLAGILIQMLCICLAAWRWRLIMKRLACQAPLLFFIGSFFKGTFVSQALPSSVGGDAVRILDLRRRGCPTLEAVSGVFVDRFAGLAGLLLLNIGALLLHPDVLPARLRLALLGLVTLLLAVLVALLQARRLRLLRGARLVDAFYRFSENYARVYSSPWPIFVQVGISVVIHLLAMITFYAMGRAVGLDLPFSTYLVLVPPVVLLTLVPVSLAGWGLREGGMLGLFSLVGADRHLVLSFSILYGLMLLISSLPGLAAYLLERGAAPDCPETSAQQGNTP